MNHSGTGPPTPTALPPPRKPFPTAAVVLGVAGLLIALAAVGGLKAFHAIKDGSAQATAVGNSFLDSMGKHNYSAARSLFTPQVQANTPAGNLRDVEVLAEKHHGAFVSHGSPSWNMQNVNGQTSVRLAYPARFTRNTSTVSMTLVQTDRGYRVYEAHYEF